MPTRFERFGSYRDDDGFGSGMRPALRVHYGIGGGKSCIQKTCTKGLIDPGAALVAIQHLTP